MELLVKVKEEQEDEDIDQGTNDISDKKPDIDQSDSEEKLYNDFSSLAQLAEISLVAEGKTRDEHLSEKIRQARELQQYRVGQQNGNQVPNPISQARTMQIVLPDNASHIIICTNENNNNNRHLNGNPSVIGPPRLLPKPPNMTSMIRANHKLERSVKQSRFKTNKNKIQNAYHCGECGKTYSTSSNLARHKQTHR